MNTTVGTCGNCGGPVQVPTAWYGVLPPTPTCGQCGATAKPNHGRVLPMNPAPHKPALGGAGDTEWMRQQGYAGDGYDVLTVSAGSPKPPAWVGDGE